MSEIADAAGISKSLLFHYFRNKKELYLFLWDVSAHVGKLLAYVANKNKTTMEVKARRLG